MDFLRRLHPQATAAPAAARLAPRLPPATRSDLLTPTLAQAPEARSDTTSVTAGRMRMPLPTTAADDDLATHATPPAVSPASRHAPRNPFAPQAADAVARPSSPRARPATPRVDDDDTRHARPASSPATVLHPASATAKPAEIAALAPAATTAPPPPVRDGHAKATLTAPRPTPVRPVPATVRLGPLRRETVQQANPRPEPAPPPIVHLSIDRIDVRVPPAPAAAPKTAPRTRPSSSMPSLGEYLRTRQEDAA